MSEPKVPLLDLKAQYQPIRAEIEAAIRSVVESQIFILGPEVTAMEKEIAEYCNAKHCIGMSSGTDALLAALMAFEIGPGDEVVTTPYSFFATAGAVARLGARPIFVDIDPTSFNIDPTKLEAAITPSTKAIIPVHLYGQCAEMDPIMAIANKYHVPVVEDAAQAIGSEYRGQRAGSIGAIGCFSFFPSKNLGAFGDGGAVTTNDDALAERLTRLRMHGMKPKYYHQIIGGNFRLDALQAAVLRIKLRHLDSWTAGRQRNAANYDRLFAAAGLAGSLVTTPKVVQNRHIFNQYIVRVVDRDAVLAYLTQEGIGSEIYYPLPLHRQQCFESLGYKAGDFPESEKAAATTLALPIYPELTLEQQERVVAKIAAYYANSERLPTRKAA